MPSATGQRQTTNTYKIMNKNTSIAVLAALNAKRETIKNKIARYTEYIEQDKQLVEKNPGKYANRLRNHENKLQRQKDKLAAIEETLAANA